MSEENAATPSEAISHPDRSSRSNCKPERAAPSASRAAVSPPIELEIESQYWPPTVRLAWPSVPGERYVLESSENLIDWVSVHEKSAGSSGVVFHAERSWFGERYYRVKQITSGR